MFLFVGKFLIQVDEIAFHVKIGSPFCLRFHPHSNVYTIINMFFISTSRIALFNLLFILAFLLGVIRLVSCILALSYILIYF